MVTFKKTYNEPLEEAEELQLESFYIACQERNWSMLEDRMRSAVKEERYILVRAMLNAFDSMKNELPKLSNR